MPNRILCPKCHGQRATSCPACAGTGKRSPLGAILGDCKECNGTGRRRCEVCGGTGEVEPANPK
jgi:DnaJ-class molecular chaperone